LPESIRVIPQVRLSNLQDEQSAGESRHFCSDFQSDLVLTEQYVSRSLAGDLVQLTEQAVSKLVALDDAIGSITPALQLG
jgi:hypothetical protein